MRIADYRKDVLKISQEQFAQQLGLKSKSRMSEIEAKNRCSARVALEIERISEGAISAAAISETVSLVRQQAA